MNLFSDETVIIIGAGASVPFGLPTGLGILDTFQKAIELEIKELIKLESNYHFGGNFPFRAPISYALFFTGDVTKNMNPTGAIHKLQEKLNWLIGQTSDSIDDLIRYNPDEALFLKIGIAHQILSKCFISRNGKYIPNKFEERIYLKSRNWIHRLINIARSEYDEKKDLINDNKIKIISFNYDGILEYVLEKCWGQVSKDLPYWRDCFEIFHPHGYFPIKNEFHDTNLCSEIIEFTKKIAVVKENQKPQELDTVIDRTRLIIGNCTKIYSIGFAFARSNCELLGISDNWCKGQKQIHYLNYDDSFGLRTRVLKYSDPIPLKNIPSGHMVENKTIYEMTPKQGESLEVHEALMAGLIGEMPS